MTNNSVRLQQKLEHMKVLVVDDSVQILEVIKDILSGHNVEVEIANNGAQALDKYSRFRPDIVTLDLAMPVMDGYETLTRMVELDGRPRIIMLTASDHHEVVQRCLQKGAIGYLAKPFSSEQLIHAVMNASSLEYDRNNSVFFSLVTCKLEEVIKKTFDPLASLVLNDIVVINKESYQTKFSTLSDLSQTKCMSKAMQTQEIDAPVGTIGYITEFSGQQHGKVVSFVKDKDLGTLCGYTRVKSTDCESQVRHEMLEFFNIINQKVISMLVSTTHLRLETAPARLYDETCDKYVCGEALVAIFEINLQNSRIPLQMHLCTNDRR